MNKNSIVQIESKGVLDKQLNGCIGFVKEINGETVSVNIYHPHEPGHAAWVITFDIPKNHITYIGEPHLKPL